jgi:hypothetical protein
MAMFFLPAVVFAAALPHLTPKQFLKAGAGVLVGEIVDVQVVWHRKEKHQIGREIGKAVIKVHEVLSGQLDAPLVIFPYDRRLKDSILNPEGWDYVPPVKGKKLIIYFWNREKDGTYGLSESVLHPQYGPYYLRDAHDDPKVRALFETADKDRTYYLDYPSENPVQEIRSFDDPKVKELREITGH